MGSYSPYILKKVGKVFKWVGIVLLITIVLFLLVVLIARTINRSKTKINTSNGIEEIIYVNIGGIEQSIQIRGEDANNPIILFLHGGPGSPHAYMSYYYQTELEADYTVVNWDQRGCGRTYYANPNLEIETELSVEILLNDLDEIVDYLTNRFDQDKVIIMGHSWGTVLGSIYVKDYPEKVSAYIGIGQTINMLAGETLAVERANKFAVEDGNKEYINKLSILFNKFSEAEDFDSLDFRSFMNMRNLTSQYLSSDTLTSTIHTMWLGISSPNMSILDIRWFLKPIIQLEEYIKIEKPLLEYSFFSFNLYDHGMEYEVPVYFISGDKDWITPYPLVQEYDASIKAPDKEMILLANVGHIPFIDNPGAFNDAVKRVLDCLCHN